MLASLARLHRGDVIEVPTGKFAGFAVVLDPGTSPEGPRPHVLTAERQARRLTVLDFPTPVTAVTRLRMPRGFNARNPQMRRDLASSLRASTHNLTPPPPSRDSDRTRLSDDPEVEALRVQLRAHPCHECPDREEHARWAERWFKLDRDARTLERRVEQRTNTVARQFDRVCEVLAALGYLADDEVTDLGRPLRRIYSELDLVVAEALRLGVLDGLGPAGLASALSTLVYESRRPEDVVSPRLPGGETRRAIDDLERLWRELTEVERQHRLDFLRRPDAGLAWAAYRWTEGDDLAEVLDESDLTAGDFVRWVKQLIDLAARSPTPQARVPCAPPRETSYAGSGGASSRWPRSRTDPRAYRGATRGSPGQHGPETFDGTAEPPALGQLLEERRVTGGGRQGRVVRRQVDVAGHGDDPRGHLEIVGRIQDPASRPGGHLGGRVGRGGDDAAEVAEPQQQRGGRLLADPGHAGEPVRGVAAHGREVGVLTGQDSVLADHHLVGDALVVAHPARDVEHPDPRAGRRPAGTGPGRR